MDKSDIKPCRCGAYCYYWDMTCSGYAEVCIRCSKCKYHTPIRRFKLWVYSDDMKKTAIADHERMLRED